MKIQEIFSFLIGVVGGFVIFQLMTQNFWTYSATTSKNYRSGNIITIKKINKNKSNSNDIKLEQYEHKLADKLFNEVKILCWVFTHPENHKTKVPHVRNTWGKRCNKLLFISSQEVENAPDIVELPIEDGRTHLWNKTKLTMKYVYENYINDFDWFMRADDDNYIVMENLRYMLYQYHPQTALYIGCRFAINYPGTEDGYHAGGGHIFSKKALKKFVEISLNDHEKCVVFDSQFDDVYVGRCLKGLALFVNDHDEFNQKRFFPYSLEAHFEKKLDPNTWYSDYLWKNVTPGGLQCCSDTFVEMHYVLPDEMQALEFLIYHLHPFGLQKNLTEKLPRKFSLNEIIETSDQRSFAKNYREHERIHHFDDDEKY